MNTSLEGKNALVFGGSRGIGRAIAIELAGLGASVTTAARTAEEMAMLLQNLDTSKGQDHDYVVIDMNQTGDLIKKIRSVSLLKPIHILINNSGGPPGGPIIDAKDVDFMSAMQLHLLANHNLVKILTPGMKKEGYGRVINIISTSVKEPIPGLGVSNTTRGAVAAWAKTLATELGPSGITVNNILPGFTRTERLESLFAQWAEKEGLSQEAYTEKMAKTVPLQRLAEPAEVAAVAAFLATPAAAYVNGVSLAVDGGRLRGI